MGADPLRRAGLSAPTAAAYRLPRPQTAQCHAHPRWPDQTDRLRHRALVLLGPLARYDAARHRRLRATRAIRRALRAAFRPVRARRNALPSNDRARARIGAATDEWPAAHRVARACSRHT